MHHLQDSHDFNLLSYTNNEGEKVHLGIPLPVILWDEGLQVFSSSRLHHGESVAHVGDKYYKLEHSKIYKTDSSGLIELDEFNHPINIAPLDFSLTKGVVSIIFTSLLMFFLFKGLADSYKKNNLVAKGIGRFFEPIVIYVRDEIAIPNIGEKYYKNYMSYLLTLFFFGYEYISKTSREVMPPKYLLQCLRVHIVLFVLNVFNSVPIDFDGKSGASSLFSLTLNILSIT